MRPGVPCAAGRPTGQGGRDGHGRDDMRPGAAGGALKPARATVVDGTPARPAAGSQRGGFANRSSMPLRIAQITDLHIGFEPGNTRELNSRRLEAVLARLAGLAPDIVLVTGDLTEHGDCDSYARLGAMLERSGLRVRLLVGNHDRRDAFASELPGFRAADGFVHHVLDLGDVRIVALDTLEEGRHGGAFCGARARWLEETLAAAPDRPTLVALHHPPVETGIAWMTAPPLAPWARRLEAVLARHPQVRLVVAGHIHRAMAAGFAGRPLLVCPACAPQLALDFRPIAPDAPDGRPMVVAEPPGFALHLWTGDAFVSHFGVVDGADVIVAHDRRMAAAIAPILAEQAADRAAGAAGTARRGLRRKDPAA